MSAPLISEVIRCFCTQDGVWMLYVPVKNDRGEYGLVHVSSPREYRVGASVGIERHGPGWRLSPRDEAKRQEREGEARGDRQLMEAEGA
jgi:hypothetical protein